MSSSSLEHLSHHRRRSVIKILVEVRDLSTKFLSLRHWQLRQDILISSVFSGRLSGHQLSFCRPPSALRSHEEESIRPISQSVLETSCDVDLKLSATQVHECRAPPCNLTQQRTSIISQTVHVHLAHQDAVIACRITAQHTSLDRETTLTDDPELQQKKKVAVQALLALRSTGRWVSSSSRNTCLRRKTAPPVRFFCTT